MPGRPGSDAVGVLPGDELVACPRCTLACAASSAFGDTLRSGRRGGAGAALHPFCAGCREGASRLALAPWFERRRALVERVGPSATP